jgi:hypothetical protein
MPLVLVKVSDETQGRAQRWLDVVKRLARVSELVFVETVPDGAVQLLVRGEVAALPLKGVIDFNAVLSTLHAGGYEGWLVVEAEQDPAVAPSYAYAKKGFDTLKGIVTRLNG